MNILSLFDGMSCGQLALNRAGIKYDKYFASEIDKHAIKVTQHNYPGTIQLGDVKDIKAADLPTIDLLIGGSPCQGFSFAGLQLAFDDPRSKLFFEYIRIYKELREANPNVKFLLENVKMKKQYKDIISQILGVEPIEINSALVSAQNRRRFYWTNINQGNIPQPSDKGILLRDIVLSDALPVTYTETRTDEAKKIRRECQKNEGRDFSPRRGKILVPRQDEKANCITATKTKEHLLLSKKALDYMDRIVSGGRNHWDFAHHSDVRDEKSSAVVANFFKGVPYNVLKDFDCIRHFDVVECERLQTVPDGYTSITPKTQAFKMIGNGWTIDVISHILSFLN